jgi:thioredoxin
MTTKKRFSNFQDMLADSELPVLVDFYAPWCGPCQMMAKILEQVNAQMSQKMRVVKINTDIYPAIASQYQVEALPTLMLFKNGQPVERIEGVVVADQLIQHLNTLI